MEGYAAWQQNVEYTAREDRSVLAAVLSEGVLDPDDGGLLVTERAAGASMSVDVAAGTCVVEGTEQADQYTYLCVFEDGDNLPVDSADPSDPRVDRVVVRVRDSAVSGASDDPIVEVLTGTPAADPDPPSLPDSAVTLALVDVGAGVSSITDADITDERPTGSAGGLSEATANATYQPQRLKVERSNKDDDGIFRDVTYRRHDGTAWMESRLRPEGSGPEYDTREIDWYEDDGTTVRDSVTLDLTYDGDGELVSEAVAS